MSATDRLRPQAPVSRALTEGPQRAAARAYLKGIGYDDEDLAKPIIGVANTWIETMPCNFHLRALAEHVKDGIRAAGGTPMEFNTIAISDGITMGTEGMKTSLVRREVIADSIELVARGHLFDAVVALSGCDKTIPGTVMALARLDVPGVMLYGGSIPPGRFRGPRRHDPGRLRGASARTPTGRMTDEELHELEDDACPGAGACGGQFTANTMAMAFEVLGISPVGHRHGPRRGRRARTRSPSRPASSSWTSCAAADRAPATHHAAGARERDRRRRRHRRLDQRRPAPAGRRHARPASTLTIDDFDAISDAHAAAVRPQARRRATTPPTSYRAGGVPLVVRAPARGRPAARRTRITVTGQTVGEIADDAQSRPPARRSCGRSTTRSSRPAAWRSCAATSRPRAASSSSPATSAATTAARRASSSARRPRWRPSLARRHQGRRRRRHPQRGPRRRPRHARDARGHRRRSTAPGSARTSRCSPTAASAAPRTASWPATSPPRPSRGGPIAAVRDGDTITIDVDARRLDVDLVRRRDRRARRRLDAAEPGPHRRLAKYAELVSSASEGAITASGRLAAVRAEARARRRIAPAPASARQLGP